MTDQKESPRGGSRISPQTLIIASVASAAASFAVARIWGAGTLFGAATAPVIVALVSEFLRRPVQTVTATAKRRPTAQGKPALRSGADAAPPGPVEPAARVTPDAASETLTPDVASETLTPVAAGRWRPHWRLVLATGGIALAIVVGLYTVADLVAGHSITGNGQPTTFLGGSANTKQKTKQRIGVTTVVTATTPATVTQTVTAPQPTSTKTTTTGTTPTTSTTTQTDTQTTAITVPTTSTTPTTP
jgi:hypothetical protein